MLFRSGRDFDEAREYVEATAPVEGWRYVHSANEPLLTAGVGTYAIEIFEKVFDLDYLFVPIGGGSGASGYCIARDGLSPKIQVIGVQAAGADAVARSLRTGQRVVGTSANTFADGLATRVTFDLTFGILSRRLDDVVTLDEDELEDGVRAALAFTHNLAEGAGAATLAAAKKYVGGRGGVKVACVMTGGNIDGRTLTRVLSSRSAPL